MELKLRVAKLLEDNGSESLSGEKIADLLGVSRNAVWKAVKALKADGYGIEAVTNKGYRITHSADIISAEGICVQLPPEIRARCEVEVQKTVSSTNTVLKMQAQEGAKSGKIVVACEQTAGKGRLGRSFYSPSGSGIYMSILLRPTLTVENSLMITICASVAVAEAIELVCKADAKIKWVNDVFVGGKKVCGILTEASVDFESGGLDYAIMGCGIDVYPPKSLNDDLQNIVGFVCNEETPNLRNKLCAEVITRFLKMCDDPTKPEYLDEYRKRSFLVGKAVNVISQGGAKTEQAVAIEIDGRGRMVVQYADGRTEAVSSGEISLRAID